MLIKFLIIDEEINDLESLTEILEKMLPPITHDFKILQARSALTACKLFREEKPDFVIVDMRMDIEQGRRLVTDFPRMAEAFGDPHFKPRYLVTSFDPHDLDQGRIWEIYETCKLDGFLLKPFKEWTVRYTLSRALGKMMRSILVEINPHIHNYCRAVKFETKRRAEWRDKKIEEEMKRLSLKR